ncbi:MAG: cytochrome c [Gemmatimonadota bacterium]|nr:cytochrome c [Gemmatimonadota bacterium]
MPRRRLTRYPPLLRLWVLPLLALACGEGPERNAADVPAPPPPPTPAEHVEGESLFAANCVVCHGQHARGTALGPPLVHIVYEPNHHSDAAFYYAASNGVVQHHWRFGNMPPQPQVPREAMTRIIGYVRWLQRDAGID